jgi:hypothetical protein
MPRTRANAGTGLFQLALYQIWGSRVEAKTLRIDEEYGVEKPNSSKKIVIPQQDYTARLLGM